MLRHWKIISAMLFAVAVLAGCTSTTTGQGDSEYANAVFSANSWAGLTLGSSADEIGLKHDDFPSVADTGAVTVTWQDCDLGFDSGTLISISPRSGGKTDTGVTVGSALTEAQDVYGDPVELASHDDGTATAVFLASIEHESGFRMELDSPSGSVRSVTLCNCLPEGWDADSATRAPSTNESSQATSAQRAPSDTGSASGTQKVVLRPVDANGNAAAGFSIDNSDVSGYAISCGSDTARAAVDDNIFYCSPNASGAYSCWPSANPMTVLCLRDPFEQTLTALVTEEPAVSASAPSEPQPIGLVLEDGAACTLRHGGAWPGRDDLYAAYSCDSEDLIWADSSDSIDKSSSDWQVLTGGFEGPLRNAKVAKALYVGVA